VSRAPRPVTAVAVGVLVRPDGAVLMADRPDGKPYAGYWEFPGGKIEPGEDVDGALARELHEELGLRIAKPLPWVVLEHDYPHAYVRLHFRRVLHWQGEPRPVEGQRLRFVVPGGPVPAPLLPAAVPAMRWVGLPAVCAWSPGTAGTAAAAVQWLEGALQRGLRLVLWHEPALVPEERARALTGCAQCAAQYGALLLAQPAGGALPREAGPAAGWILTAGALRRARVRPPGAWVAALVAREEDLAHAARLGCDFAVAADPGLPLDGTAALPVYACAPAGAAELARARMDGAQGLVRAPGEA